MQVTVPLSVSVELVEASLRRYEEWLREAYLQNVDEALYLAIEREVGTVKVMRRMLADSMLQATTVRLSDTDFAILWKELPDVRSAEVREGQVITKVRSS